LPAVRHGSREDGPLSAAGVHVVKSPADMGVKMREALGKRNEIE
jgi:hypothetical protein